MAKLTKRSAKPPKSVKFSHAMILDISQAEARAIAMGNFLPRSVADKMIANIETLYQRTEPRERVAKLGGFQS